MCCSLGVGRSGNRGHFGCLQCQRPVLHCKFLRTGSPGRDRQRRHPGLEDPPRRNAFAGCADVSGLDRLVALLGLVFLVAMIQPVLQTGQPDDLKWLFPSSLRAALPASSDWVCLTASRRASPLRAGQSCACARLPTSGVCSSNHATQQPVVAVSLLSHVNLALVVWVLARGLGVDAVPGHNRSFLSGPRRVHAAHLHRWLGGPRSHDGRFVRLYRRLRCASPYDIDVVRDRHRSDGASWRAHLAHIEGTPTTSAAD